MQKITGIACTLLEVKYEELNRIWRKTLIFKLFPLSFVFWHLLWGAGQTPCLVLHGQVLSPFLKKMATAGSQSRAGDFLCKCRDWTESSKQNKFSLQMSRWYHQLLEVTPTRLSRHLCCGQLGDTWLSCYSDVPQVCKYLWKVWIKWCMGHKPTRLPPSSPGRYLCGDHRYFRTYDIK